MKTTMNTSTSPQGYSRVIIDPEIKTPENDPFVKQKVDRAIELLKNSVFPAGLKKKMSVR